MKQIQELLQIRKSKGNEIAKTGKVKLNGYKWVVPSQSSNKQYEVLEPSCGDGVFLEQIKENEFEYKSITAIEIDKTEA